MTISAVAYRYYATTGSEERMPYHYSNPKREARDQFALPPQRAPEGRAIAAVATTRETADALAREWRAGGTRVRVLERVVRAAGCDLAVWAVVTMGDRRSR